MRGAGGRRAGWIALLLVLALLVGCGAQPAQGPQPTDMPQSTSAPGELAPAEPGEYRAVWISYLEWQGVDFSTEEGFRAQVQQMLDHCADLGLNTVIAQVRSFGDALYPSRLFPWSHLCTGQQGQDPGYDPLAILVQEAHARSLRLEAWVNPYRVALPHAPQGDLAPTNPAVVHPEWVKQVVNGDGGVSLFLEPSSGPVQQYILDGVLEILDRYPVDGIHFDDYFYPDPDPAFDAGEYGAAGSGLSLEEWRRGNVNALVSAVYDGIKAHSPGVSFGISPQGNPDNNYHSQYSDVGLWMRQGGYVDYVMPQLYWGYGYTTQGGSTRFAFENITREWAGMERAPSVALYAGLGAYRIGVGDGSSDPGSAAQWSSGHNLADMMDTLDQAGFDGYALFRYDHLFRSDDWAQQARQEAQAIRGRQGAAA